MSKAPRRDLKDSQALGRSPATTSRKRATLLQQPATEARPAVTSTGGFVSRAARTTKSACGPARAPPSALQPSPLGLSSPSCPSDASPAWDGHPSELGRRSVPHPLRVSVGYVQRRKVRHSAADPWHGHRGGGVQLPPGLSLGSGIRIPSVRCAVPKTLEEQGRKHTGMW